MGNVTTRRGALDENDVTPSPNLVNASITFKGGRVRPWRMVRGGAALNWGGPLGLLLSGPALRAAISFSAVAASYQTNRPRGRD
jgi:hypothetical protein